MNSGQKLAVAKSLNDIGIRKARDLIQQIGKELPASIVSVKGSIATVKFEVGGGYNLPNIQIPIIEPLYSRGGWKSGDKGFVAAGSVPHGNMSGLGPSSPPGMAVPANLSALAFHPLGNVNWPDTGGVRINQAQNGSIAQTIDSKNQAGGIPPGVLLTAQGVSTILNAQMIAKLAGLVGASCTGGGGGAWGGSSGFGYSAHPATGVLPLQQLILAYQYVQPTTGATVIISANVVTTIIDPAGALAALTVDFPAVPVDGQVQFLAITQAVTTLTLGGGAFGVNAPTSAPSGGAQWTFQYLAASGKWQMI